MKSSLRFLALFLLCSASFAQADSFDPKECFVVSKERDASGVLMFDVNAGFSLSLETPSMTKESLLGLLGDLSSFSGLGFNTAHDRLEVISDQAFQFSSSKSDAEAGKEFAQLLEPRVKALVDLVAKHPEASFGCSLRYIGSVNEGN